MLICHFQDLPESGTRAFKVQGRSVLVVQHAPAKISIFLNRCPHLGVPLQWKEGNYLDPDGVLIQCATHGALFEKDTGLCIQGPCRGEYLWELDHTIQGQEIHFDESELPPLNQPG